MKVLLLTLRSIVLLLPRSKPFTYVNEILRRFFSFYVSPIVIKNFNENHSFNCFLNDHISSQIFWKGIYSSELPNLRKLIHEGDYVLDIGANIGEFSVYMGTSFKNLNLFAFEPVTTIRNKFENNVKINSIPKLKIFPFGLSNQKGELPIYGKTQEKYKDGTYNEGMATIYKNENRKDFIQNIQLEQLDSVLIENNIPKIDFIKMDIEGAELYALQGALESLKKFHPKIWMEINPETMKAAGYDSNDVLTLIESLGYTPNIFVNNKLVKAEDLDKCRDILLT